MSHFELLSAKEYATALHTHIPQAKKRITVAAMVMRWDEEMAPYFDLLLDAQERGVHVRLLYDRYSWLPFAFDQMLPSKDIRSQVTSLKAFSARLEAAGGQVTLVGKEWSRNPFARRQHAKVTLIDDTAYSFGGINFSSNHFVHNDVMLRKKDAKLAAHLESLVAQMSLDRPVKNCRIVIDENSTILFDGGTPSDSIIYDTACKLAEKASEVYFVSQYCPSGRLVEALAGKTACYFNQSKSMPGVLARITNRFDERRYHIRNLYTKKPYIHAKFMLFVIPGGSHVCLTGSNNFSWRGVAYGTKEIALVSYDKTLWQQLYHYFEENIR